MLIAAMVTILALSEIPPIDGGFREDMLNEHNRFRKLHGVPNMELDHELSNSCEDYAKEIANLDNDPPYSQLHNYDESLCCKPSDPLTCVQEWYEEIKNYDFDNAKYVEEAHSFVNIVWKAERKLGVGQATGNNNDGQQVCVVARYTPDIGLNEDYKENVPKPITSESRSTTSSSSIVWNTYKCLALVTLSWLAIYYLC